MAHRRRLRPGGHGLLGQILTVLAGKMKEASPAHNGGRQPPQDRGGTMSVAAGHTPEPEEPITAVRPDILPEPLSPGEAPSAGGSFESAPTSERTLEAIEEILNRPGGEASIGAGLDGEGAGARSR
jgi:hypothetical protein